MDREGSGFPRGAMSFLKAHEVVAGNQITEIQMRRSVFLDCGGKKGLAIPGRTFEFASEGCARRAIKRFRRFGRSRARRQMMKA
eukprot:8997255-Heterocapsa_arctica.AAC.1